MSNKNTNKSELKRQTFDSFGEEGKETVIRKSFSLTKEDIERIQKVKDNGLNRRLVISDSQVIRLGIKLAYKLSEAKLMEQIEDIPQLQMGRPKKK